ncbi:YgeY family selenium metabolism-linked hydrolase [Clostridium botulinum D/C]|uniref:YgeY family selenium metabolism-linked hydrolase n=1 Tax=Clostridium botulinum TaxID=1491 RepID=UPI001E30B1FC|nr:YgeY family selenium metabolism-linked hydrolase [Clostridium botulinum]MCD3350505.1 YgeY family selenium metabolism-linked hydrolase [Clostridium botulinum D/C]MCD3359524.1 YgeY family selenium metabolism-linked hydrolase [Clostridium botulinum D/C]MCD3363253.1 YgeY family selenium metabolism-linked hydrolase [Clostridium botulinum D/C]MCD3365220.1 YgeY family selenium metabolism-linked hydrolase [Clostridium botulinum D/C]
MDIKSVIIKKIEDYRGSITNFLIDMINIHSVTYNEKEVILRVKEEMDKIGFDETFIDGMGNIIGRLGNGSKVIAIEAHVDTVDVGDDDLWNQNPFSPEIKDDVIYGRGTLEQKGAMASIVYSGKAIKDLDLTGDYTVYVIGSIMKEEYDGEAWKYIIEKDNIKPDFVVITEPTNLNIHIGSRGRAEIEVIINGLSTDSGDCIRGINAIYKALPVVKDLEKLNQLYKSDILGKASISVNKISCESPSKSCISDKCIISIDRRMVLGENVDDIIKELSCLKSIKNHNVKINIANKITYTGYSYSTNNILKPWIIDKDSFILKKTIEAYKTMYDIEPEIKKSILTTNGSITYGMFKIPTIGFGPGKEILAYSPREQVSIDDLIKACELYAILPLKLSTK